MAKQVQAEEIGNPDANTVQFAQSMLREQFGRDPSPDILSRVVDQLMAVRPRATLTLADLYEEERMRAAMG